MLPAAMCIILNKPFTGTKDLLSTMSLLFNNYSLVEVIYLLIRFNKSKFFLSNKNNTDGNGVKKQHTHTHTHTHKHTKHLER